MILKAGTYRFNETPTELEFEQSINLTVGGIEDGVAYAVYASKISTAKLDYFAIFFMVDSLIVDGEEQLNEETLLPVYSTNGSGWSFSRVHTITEDTEVDDTFGAWYIDNTNYNEVINPPLAEITYNGETIAKLNAGETVILKCEGLPMETDIIVKVNG